ncbi:hypothetical protein CHUAL_005269 [Chamberlinius hualienensis]
MSTLILVIDLFPFQIQTFWFIYPEWRPEANICVEPDFLVLLSAAVLSIVKKLANKRRSRRKKLLFQKLQNNSIVSSFVHDHQHISTMPVRLASILLLVIVLVALAFATEVPSKRKHKKYDPLSLSFTSGAKDDGLPVSQDQKPGLHRSPRQANLNERRQYYPCISCFRVGTREICTSPYCPENYQCDRASKRCHKKANVRNRPEEEVEQTPAPPPTNTGSTGGRGK